MHQPMFVHTVDADARNVEAVGLFDHGLIRVAL
jgi:hypothetical protein